MQARLPAPRMLRAEFLRWMLDSENFSPETRKGYQQKADQAERFTQATFGRRLLRCQEEHIRAYLSTFPWPRTRNSHRTALQAYYRFLLERGYRAKDPVAGIKRLSEPKYLPRPITGDHVKRLRGAAATLSLRHRLIVDLGLFAGLRRAEIARLRWSDVDFGKARLRVFGKGRKEGIVPIHDELVAELSLWRLTMPSDEWVFPSPYGRPRHIGNTTVGVLYREATDRAGVKTVPHQTRHTFATELLDRGADIRHVQELLRHTSLSSTQIYTQVSVKRLEEDVARLDFG